MLRRFALPLVLAATAVALWPLPVFQVLHAESSAVVSGVAFFATGLVALRELRAGRPLQRVLAASLAALLVPLALLTASLLWAPNRGYPLGLLLYATMAVPGVVLAVALAAWLDASRLRRKRTAFVLAGLAVAFGGVLFDLGLHPQFYTYSHVFGGVLGPIYDEELAVRPGFFAFRGVTLGWAALLLLTRRTPDPRPAWRRPAVRLVAAGLALAYAFSGRLGFSTSHADLARALPRHVQTPHFDLHFASDTPDDEALRIALDHEYRYAWLADTLGSAPAHRIRSYVYPDAATKGRLTGAAVTSVAPVWLARPQVHVAREHVDGVLGHELVHAFSRDFALPVVRASRYVGLVEGLAVAFEPPDGAPSPHAQVSSQMLARSDTLLGARLARTLGAGGFWTGRGAVSYTTTGSFVAWLARTYGPARVRAVYAGGNFADVFGADVDALGRRWERWLRDSLETVSASAGPVAAARFSRPSLFETPSPHHVPRHVRLTRAAALAAASGDTLEALALVGHARTQAPGYAPALDLHARLALARGLDLGPLLPVLDSIPALALRAADARAARGDTASARRAYDALARRLPAWDHDAAARLWLRQRLALAHGADLPRIVRTLYAAPARLGADAPGPLAALLARRDDAPGPDEWPAEAPRAQRQRFEAVAHAWASDAAWAHTRFPEAARHAEAAARRFAAIDDHDAAALWRDRAARARFAARHAPALAVALGR